MSGMNTKVFYAKTRKTIFVSFLMIEMKPLCDASVKRESLL